MSEPQSLIWITGATSGIGEALAKTVPLQAARIINIARRRAPDYENVVADLSQPADWDLVTDKLRQEFANFVGERAIFINNAFAQEPVGRVGEVDPEQYQRHILTNAVAPLVLGEAFLRLCPKNVEGGLVMVSSAAARVVFPGRAGYGAAKAGMEQWVRTVRAELAERGSQNWAIALRPGAVDTPSLRADAAADESINPLSPQLRRAFAEGTVDSALVAARRMWEHIPPPPDSPAVVLLGEMVAPAAKE